MDGAATISFVVRSPRMFAEILGKLLFWCGEDKIVYGGEAPIFHPQRARRAFMDFEIPQDLCDGYGYPQLTDPAAESPKGPCPPTSVGSCRAMVRVYPSAYPDDR